MAATTRRGTVKSRPNQNFLQRSLGTNIWVDQKRMQNNPDDGHE
jgi:hypothetical protein